MRGAELSAKGGVTGVGMSLWGPSYLPPLLENLIAMDKAGMSSDRPFGTPCDEARGGSGGLCRALL